MLPLRFFTGSKNTDLDSVSECTYSSTFRYHVPEPALTFVFQLKLCDADKASLSSFESATASDIGGKSQKFFLNSKQRRSLHHFFKFLVTSLVLVRCDVEKVFLQRRKAADNHRICTWSGEKSFRTRTNSSKGCPVKKCCVG